MIEHPTLSSKLHGGFTLVEMAMVLMILGLLLGGILTAVGDSTNSIRITNARTQLKQIEEALYGYAQANGRLPCPADETGTGLSDPETDTGCNIDHGFIPVATLGLNGSINSDGLLLDPWQNPYRYSVSQDATNYFTTSAGMQTLFSNASTLLGVGTDMLRVCDISTCAGVIAADAVPAIVYSMGANWAELSVTSSADEQKNAFGGNLTGTNSALVYNMHALTDKDFVDTGYSEANYDDQLVWLSPYVLFSRLVQAGQLP
jgi:prepilin-type N-terminal cleavage/methylation domain-containing protein